MMMMMMEVVVAYLCRDDVALIFLKSQYLVFTRRHYIYEFSSLKS